jgi:hypothetical protein
MCVLVTDRKDCYKCENNIFTKVEHRICYKAEGVFGDCGIIDEIEAYSKGECAECEEKRKKAEEEDK